MDLGLNDLQITIHRTPDEAPNYAKPEFLPANLKTARVIGFGTVNGQPTVDFIFEDEKGQKHVAMLTGKLVLGLGQVITAQMTPDKESG